MNEYVAYARNTESGCNYDSIEDWTLLAGVSEDLPSDMKFNWMLVTSRFLNESLESAKKKSNRIFYNDNKLENTPHLTHPETTFYPPLSHVHHTSEIQDSDYLPFYLIPVYLLFIQNISPFVIG